MVATPSRVSQRVLLEGVSWETYQCLLHDWENRPGERLTYDNGVLEIVSPLPKHEKLGVTLSRLVEATTRALGVEVLSLKSTTWSREDLKKGVEGDESFYIQNEAVVRNKDRIDLSADPPPDLIIETDITSGSLDKIAIYQALGVRELWRFDGDRLTIYCLAEGEYKTSDTSRALPILSVADIESLLAQRQGFGQNAFSAHMEEWLREKLELAAVDGETEDE